MRMFFIEYRQSVLDKGPPVRVGPYTRPDAEEIADLLAFMGCCGFDFIPETKDDTSESQVHRHERQATAD